MRKVACWWQFWCFRWHWMIKLHLIYFFSFFKEPDDQSSHTSEVKICWFEPIPIAFYHLSYSYKNTSYFNLNHLSYGVVASSWTILICVRICIDQLSDMFAYVLWPCMKCIDQSRVDNQLVTSFNKKNKKSQLVTINHYILRTFFCIKLLLLFSTWYEQVLYPIDIHGFQAIHG